MNKLTTQAILAILAATVWISLSEFGRNEFLLKSVWISHFEDLGLSFPSEPVNGAVWGLWSLCFAISIYFISRRFEVRDTTLISWFAGFVLMWIVTWNLLAFPLGILILAIPLSLLEAFLASWIVLKIAPAQSPRE